MLDKVLASKVFVRDNWKCRHCRDRNALHPHHVVYQSHGGPDSMNNLVTLCNQCHIDGVHGGKLLVEVTQVLENDLVVKFHRVGKWKPV